MKNFHGFVFGFILTLLVTYGAIGQQDLNGWYWLSKPQGQTINWIKVLDASNIFAVTNRGLFMKTNDGGDSWTISQAGAEDNSPDGGLSKRNLYTGWFFDANTGIVGGSPRLGQSYEGTTVVQKTTDGGVTWSTKTVNSVAGGSVNGIYFINSTTGYLCGTFNAHLYKTTDKGESWSEVLNVPALQYYSLHAFDQNKIILASDQRTIVRTSDGGTTWITDTIFSALDWTTFTSVEFRNSSTGYLTGNPNYFAYTTNGGSNWTASSPPAIEGQTTVEYNNGAVWTAGDFDKVYKSTNDGATWQTITFYDNSNSNQPNPSIIYGLGVNGNDIAVAGTDGQITISNDGGNTWRNKNYMVTPDMTGYTAIYAETNGKVFLGGFGNSMNYSLNGGANWTSIPNGFTAGFGQLFDIDFPTASTGYLCGGNAFMAIGEMSKTTNGGATWNGLTLPSPISVYQLNDVEFVDVNTGWVSGSGSFFDPPLIQKTTDGGATWTAQQMGFFGGVINVEMTDANTGYAFAASGLYSTSDGGSNWIQNSSPYIANISINNIFVLNKDVIYAYGPATNNAQLINRSTDGGSTWTDISGNLLNTASIFKSKWLNLNNGVVSGVNGFTAITTNGGQTWTQTNPGFSTTVDVAFPSKNKWFTVSDRNGAFQVASKTESNTTVTINPVIGIEGFWNGAVQVSDTITIELRSAVSPNPMVASKKSVITPGIGYGSFEFTSVSSGSYYVVVKHRNSIETWSSVPVAMSPGGNYNYNFTTAASQAYGNNLVLKLGRFCNYSGDVDQDGSIDGSDYSLVDNAALIFASGYLAEDITGDDAVDASDAAIIDNNSYNFISVIRP